jgi:phosphoribosylaminoimidazole-succinocarboxamide synthase
MRILSPEFLLHFGPKQVINLHPALPGKFPGAHAISDAFNDITTNITGVMVHYVVPEVDAGEVIESITIPIDRESDTLETLTARISQLEKSVLVNATIKALEYVDSKEPKITHGKVRDVIDIGYQKLALIATDRLSCFDRNVCKVTHRGVILNSISGWWFERTRHICPNHLLWCDTDKSGLSIVKKCKPFPIEFVVRGFLTGSTNTSIWTLYQHGEREFGGVKLPDSMKKNQQLPRVILTPTTKSNNHDKPITRDEIIQQNLMSAQEYDWCAEKALQLFEFGQALSKSSGLILADTKYVKRVLA